MKTVEIIGKNYQGYWEKSRKACRALIFDGENLLLFYESKHDIWMIPGGGAESGETDRECCAREAMEETGLSVEPGECFLQIDEYYGRGKYVNLYFVCRVTGKGNASLTEPEKEAGGEARWIPFREIKDIFSCHSLYESTDEIKRGLYFREYTALCEYEKLN